jgi:inhibitor of cysteine peptidase
MKTRYIVLIGVGAALVVVASLLTGPVVRSVRYGALFPVLATEDAQFSLDAKVGNRFSVVVRDNNSIGDDWWLKKKPAYATAELLYDEYVSQTSDTLDSGAHYYTFLPKTAGTSQIALVNMYQQASSPYTVTIDLTIS